MKSRKHKMSRKQRHNLLLTYFLLNRKLFGGMLGMDNYYHFAGVTPIPGNTREFQAVLEKDGANGSIGVNMRLVSDEDITAEYYIVLPSGDRVYGSFDELDMRQDKTPIRPLFDQLAAGLLLVEAMKTKEGHALSVKFEPSSAEYVEMLSVLRNRWGEKRFNAVFGDDEYQIASVKARHDRLLADYIYAPGDGQRNMNEDEELLVTCLFITEAMKQIKNPFRFAYCMGEIYPDAELRPWSHAFFVDTESHKHLVGIAVQGPLNKAGQDEICFACVNQIDKTGELIFFGSLQEALDSKYSEIQPLD